VLDIEILAMFDTATVMGSLCKFVTEVGNETRATVDTALDTGVLAGVVIPVDSGCSLEELVSTAQTTGIATDLGMGSVGSETAKVVRGIAPPGGIFDTG